MGSENSTSVSGRYSACLSEKKTDFLRYLVALPIPVAPRSKAWFCGRSLAGIAGSNPGWSLDSVSCEYYQVEVCASG
jgi:hypothetical protein